MQLFRNLWKSEDGQTLVEYAMILALISLGLVISLGLFRDELETVFTTLTTTLGTIFNA